MAASAGVDAGVDNISRPAGAVPAVVAVVVTCDPGDWLEEALDALGGTDYPNLSVLVIDAASAVDPTPRIAARLPSAYVRRLESNEGYAAAANEVLGVVEGASHYVFLHDDAAPDPDAIRLLVEEAFRSNAGVVGPKLVDWDDPLRLLAVGASADKAGVVRPYGRHELDQEQHDSVRDVFVAPGGCLLVRADLFTTLGGFDRRLPLIGEDLDLCWRAHVLGARVVVAPGARVRHREATASGERPLVLGETTGDLRERIARLQLRHRLRTVLKSYGPLHLLRVLPQLLVLMGAEAVGEVLAGRRRLAGAVVDACRWNLSSRGELRSARRTTQKARALKDAELRRLQTRGSVRLSAALQGGLAVEERTFGVGAAGRQFAGALTSGGLRQTLTVWSVIALVLVVGSRHLLREVPEVGQFVAFPESPMVFLRHFVSGWRTSGLGAEAPAPPAFAFLGLAGIVMFGAMELLQRILVLGMLPLGLIGMHRLTAPLGSWRARLVGVVLYAAVPMPYDAIAGGRWSGLIAYAAAPWILSRLLRATGVAPFGAPMAEHISSNVHRQRAIPPQEIESLFGAEAGTLDPLDTEELRVAITAMSGHAHTGPGSDHGAAGTGPILLPTPSWVRHPGSLGFQAAALALLLAVVGAFAPSITAAAVVAGAGLLVGGLLVANGSSGARAFAVSIAAAAGAGLLLVPWTLELLLPGATWAGYAGQGAPVTDAPGLGELLRFSTGPMGNGPLTWGLLAAAALPLVVGRRWRFTVAVRLWMVAVAAWATAWVLGRGWIGVSPPAIDVLLAPGAAGLVLAAVLGLSAFEIDLPDYRFGWRQVASLVAAGSSVLMTLPVLTSSLNGRWRAPSRDFASVLSWMPELAADGEFRVLWAGRPDAIPHDGWRLDVGLAYATSRNGPSDVTSLWPASDQGSTGLIAESLNVARRGETTRLGHLLAPMGVRFLAVPLRPAPIRSGAMAISPPDDVLAALGAQIDLRLVESDPALVVYENAAWAPAVSVLPPEAVEASRRPDLDAARTAELAGAPRALDSTGPTRYVGEWPGPELFFAEAYSRRWSFEVAGRPADHRKAFGWANAFTAGPGPEATLRFRTSPLRYAALLLESGLWVFSLRFVIRGVKRRTEETLAAEGGAS